MIVPPAQIDRMALAIERRSKFWNPAGVELRVRDEHAQEFPEEL